MRAGSSGIETGAPSSVTVTGVAWRASSASEAPSLAPTKYAGISVSSTRAISISCSSPSGWNTTAPTAPAASACSTFSRNVHVPRRTRTILSVREPAGNGRQARGSPASPARASGADSAPSTCGPMPPRAGISREPARTVCATRFALKVAATAITSGAIAGDAIVLRAGKACRPSAPALPAAATTTRPKSTTALCAATASGSQSSVSLGSSQAWPNACQGNSAGAPRLRLRMSISSATASSIAAITACEVGSELMPEVPLTL